jgi:hypothetical protein
LNKEKVNAKNREKKNTKRREMKNFRAFSCLLFFIVIVGVVSKLRYDRIPHRVGFVKCEELRLRVRLRKFQNDFEGSPKNIIFKNGYFPQRHKVHKENKELLTSKFIIVTQIIKFRIIYFNLNLCVLCAFVGYNFELLEIPFSIIVRHVPNVPFVPHVPYKKRNPNFEENNLCPKINQNKSNNNCPIKRAAKLMSMRLRKNINMMSIARAS